MCSTRAQLHEVVWHYTHNHACTCLHTLSTNQIRPSPLVCTNNASITTMYLLALCSKDRVVILSEKGMFSLSSSRQSLNCARLLFSRALCVERLLLEGGRGEGRDKGEGEGKGGRERGREV